MTKTFPTPQAFTKGPRPAIPLVPVVSSQVAAIGHDAATNTLAVQFTRGPGHTYHYPGVTAEQHKAFVESDSIGVHFGKHIKPLPFEKYEAESAPEHEHQNAVQAAAGGLAQTALER